MKPSLLAVTLLLASTPFTACIPQKPYATLGPDEWSSPLDGDLRAAAAKLADNLAAEGYPNVHVLWAGARGGHGAEYAIDRGPTGEPTAKYAQIAYAFQLADGKCYLDMDFSTLGSGPKLVRANEGGARYGEPRIRGWAPPKGGYGGRHEVVCDAVAQAKGGVREPFTLP